MTLRDVIKQLQEVYEINDAVLARETGIPQATIYRLVSGITDDPKVSSLKPLATFFNVTIGQLIGEEPLPTNVSERSATYNKWNYKLPIIGWEQACDWKNTLAKLTFTNWTDWCSTNFPVSSSAYALEIQAKTLIKPFIAGSMLIIEPNLAANDGDYVMIQVSGSNAVSLRQWVTDSAEVWLISQQTGMPPLKYTQDVLFAGVVIQLYVQLKEKISVCHT